MVTVACVLYQGEDVPAHSLGIFTPEWVDRLYRGIRRNTSHPFRFVCYCDREYEFHEPVERRMLKLPYRNMFSLLEVFREDLGRVVFMGLDTIITGDLDGLMSYDGPFAMLRDPYFPERPCSGVMAFPYTPQVWENFERDHEKHAKAHTMFGQPSDMIYLATQQHVLIDDHVDGIYSYKVHIKPNPALLQKSRIVYFHGREKPHELAGMAWVDRCWGAPLMSPVQVVGNLNNSESVMLEQFRQNLKRDLPWFSGGKHQNDTALIVGGGPSLADTLPKLRMRHGRGGYIFALNNTHDWLIERGIVPDYHVMLDSRQQNVQFVQHPHKDVHYLISAFCHPDVFEVLKGYKVTLWMSDMDGVMPMVQAIEDKPVCLVGGGATVGLKTMPMTYLMGFRKMHLFGFDSSYRGDANHAYTQPMNDKESRIEVFANGRKFTCAPWMAKQAHEWQQWARKLTALGVEIWVHGDGLIPWIAQQHAQAA